MSRVFHVFVLTKKGFYIKAYSFMFLNIYIYIYIYLIFFPRFLWVQSKGRIQNPSFNPSFKFQWKDYLVASSSTPCRVSL